MAGVTALGAVLGIVLLSSAAVQAQTVEETRFVLSHLQKIQEISFQKGREYCGFIGISPDGDWVASEAQQGDQASCNLITPHASEMRVLASYHTHGAFDAGYENELPSVIDVESDRDMGLKGWISTPGGRLWYVDGQKLIMRQICTTGCLPIHRRFYKSHSQNVQKTYTLEELRQRHSN